MPPTGSFETKTKANNKTPSSSKDAALTAAALLRGGGVIGGQAFHDDDNDGMRDDNINGFANVNVWLFSCDPPKSLAYFRTSSNGIYRFVDLPPGMYYVVAQPPRGYRFSENNFAESTIDPESGMTACFDLHGGERTMDWSFGLHRPSDEPSLQPSSTSDPTITNSSIQSHVSSSEPSASRRPSISPSGSPTTSMPTLGPTSGPSSTPSSRPSPRPSSVGTPSFMPSLGPSPRPSSSGTPSFMPSQPRSISFTKDPAPAPVTPNPATNSPTDQYYVHTPPMEVSNTTTTNNSPKLEVSHVPLSMPSKSATSSKSSGGPSSTPSATEQSDVRHAPHAETTAVWDGGAAVESPRIMPEPHASRPSMEIHWSNWGSDGNIDGDEVAVSSASNEGIGSSGGETSDAGRTMGINIAGAMALLAVVAAAALFVRRRRMRKGGDGGRSAASSDVEPPGEARTWDSPGALEGFDLCSGDSWDERSPTQPSTHINSEDGAPPPRPHSQADDERDHIYIQIPTRALTATGEPSSEQSEHAPPPLGLMPRSSAPERPSIPRRVAKVDQSPHVRRLERELDTLSVIIQSYPKNSEQWQALYSNLEMARAELDVLVRRGDSVDPEKSEETSTGSSRSQGASQGGESPKNTSRVTHSTLERVREEPDMAKHGDVIVPHKSTRSQCNNERMPSIRTSVSTESSDPDSKPSNLMSSNLDETRAPPSVISFLSASSRDSGGGASFMSNVSDNTKPLRHSREMAHSMPPASSHSAAEADFDNIRSLENELKGLSKCIQLYQKNSRRWLQLKSHMERASEELDAIRQDVVARPPHALMHVVAPTGNLGLVVDGPSGGKGGPVYVRRLHQFSPLQGQVQLGDTIVAIDDEDVRRLSPVDVGKLLSRNGARSQRKISIVRERLAARHPDKASGSPPQRHCCLCKQNSIHETGESSRSRPKTNVGEADGDTSIDAFSEENHHLKIDQVDCIAAKSEPESAPEAKASTLTVPLAEVVRLNPSEEMPNENCCGVEEKATTSSGNCEQNTNEQEEESVVKSKATITQSDLQKQDATGRQSLVEEERGTETFKSQKISVSSLPFTDELAKWANRMKTHTSISGNDSSAGIGIANQSSDSTQKEEDLAEDARAIIAPCSFEPRDDYATKTSSATLRRNDFASELAKSTSHVGTVRKGPLKPLPKGRDFASLLAKRASEVKSPPTNPGP